MTPKQFSENFGESMATLIILTIISAGIYPIKWLAERYKEWNELAGKKIYNNQLFIAVIICQGLSIIFPSIGNLFFVDTVTPGTSTISIANTFFIFGKLSIRIGGVLMIIIAWKIGKWFESYCEKEFKLNIKVNKILLILFNIFYLNYLFLKLPILANMKTQNQKLTEE